jgi:hypothetical protein
MVPTNMCAGGFTFRLLRTGMVPVDGKMHQGKIETRRYRTRRNTACSAEDDHWTTSSPRQPSTRFESFDHFKKNPGQLAPLASLTQLCTSKPHSPTVRFRLLLAPQPSLTLRTRAPHAIDGAAQGLDRTHAGSGMPIAAIDGLERPARLGMPRMQPTEMAMSAE